MQGRVYAIETLGALDGPGLRTVIFLQGCGLGCVYCHNPDTWDSKKGHDVESDVLINKAVRYKPYYRDNGGVTLSGGEPLSQPLFCAEILKGCKDQGIHTAIDTSGCRFDSYVSHALEYCDLILLDIKATDEDQYGKITQGKLKDTLYFFEKVCEIGIHIWIRHVIIPGINDTEDSIHNLITLIGDSPLVKRIDLLPYHTMGVHKWPETESSRSLKGVPELNINRLNELRAYLSKWY